MKILVVEDEPTSLKLAQLVLTADGHQVTEAEAAGKAVEEILKEQPEAVLLDLELPGMDGLALARLLKRNAVTRHIAIIAFTAFPERFSRAAAMDAGCDGYILKPINTRKLPQQVAEFVGKLK